MNRLPSVIVAAFMVQMVLLVAFGGARIEAAFEAGLIIGAATVLVHRPRS